MEHVERLASFARVLLFDKRGMGLSDRLRSVPTLEARMDDVRAVMDAADMERAAFFAAHEGRAWRSSSRPPTLSGRPPSSSTTRRPRGARLVAGSEVAFDDRGAHALKGVPGEWRLYAVRDAGTARAFAG